jgi:hypothetical protein
MESLASKQVDFFKRQTLQGWPFDDTAELMLSLVVSPSSQGAAHPLELHEAQNMHLFIAIALVEEQ